MKSIARRVSDGRMLGLIKAWLEMPVIEEDGKGGSRRTSRARKERKGTPQGAAEVPSVCEGMIPTESPVREIRTPGSTSYVEFHITRRIGSATTSSRTRSGTAWKPKAAPSSSLPRPLRRPPPAAPCCSGAGWTAKAGRTCGRPSSLTLRRHCQRPAARIRSPGGTPAAPSSSRCPSPWRSTPTRKTTAQGSPSPCR